MSVVEADNGVEITNVSELACVVFVRSPEGEQRFDLGVGERVTVADLPRANQGLSRGCSGLKILIILSLGISLVILYLIWSRKH